MKTIGFIDYYISEWHSTNYIDWFKEACQNLKKDYVIKCAYSEIEESPFDGRNPDKWCSDYGIERCKTIKEVCEKCDNIVILAPSNPETHLRLAKETFKYSKGKRIYIDKTFAPDLKTAEEIFKLAEENDVKIFTTSALRYAPEIKEFVDQKGEDFSNAKNVMISFGGETIDEYVVHPLEMGIQITGLGANKVMVEHASKRQSIIYIKFKNDKTLTLIYSPNFDFIIDAVDEDEVRCKQKPVTTFTFVMLLEDVINFFETGKTSFPREQTFEIMKIRENVLKAAKMPGKWLDF